MTQNGNYQVFVVPRKSIKSDNSIQDPRNSNTRRHQGDCYTVHYTNRIISYGASNCNVKILPTKLLTVTRLRYHYTVVKELYGPSNLSVKLSSEKLLTVTFLRYNYTVRIIFYGASKVHRRRCNISRNFDDLLIRPVKFYTDRIRT